MMVYQHTECQVYLAHHFRITYYWPMNTHKPNDLRIENLPQTLRELALERLRAAIISGRFASGERLVERTLCEQLGVSRSIVREAICFLEADGLVEIAPRSGPIVARMNWQQAKQIYDIRMLLEAKAAAECARKADATAKAALKAALLDLEAAASRAEGEGKMQDVYATSARFYELIFEVAGHSIAWEIVLRLKGRISRLRAMTLATTDRAVPGLTRITNIYDTIAANDPDLAAQAVHDHLTEASAIAQRLLDAESDSLGVA
jgi:DNA-binding GntR family transcriptional regulator